VLSEGEISRIVDLFTYRHGGLIVAIAQDVETGEVLMTAFMNREALKETLRTGLAHYFSLERKKIWMKGEVSKHYQHIESILIDCDGDAVLLKVRQEVAACHKGYRSCFFRKIEKGKIRNIAPQIFNPEKVYGEDK
jgi:phosphoribosyl-AMP cyclohydrolase